MVKLYRNHFTDPYFNLASEQYLLDTCGDDDVFMLWRNEPCVVIGRSQNAYAEINDEFVRQNNIKVVRRLTGGGAVFHDLGNVNFSCITPKKDCDSLDFKRFMNPIVDALKKIGVPAEISGRNDMLADGKKISGNAQCVYNDKVLHHGTLLFNADMSNLVGALNVDPEKIKSKGIKSVRSRVGNIAEYVNSMSVIEFMEYLENSLGIAPEEFTEADVEAITKLAREKYSTWEWNYGTSKKFSSLKKKRFDFGIIEVGYESDGKVLTDVSIKGDFFGMDQIELLEKRLCGTALKHKELESALENISSYITGATPEDIISLIL